MSLAKGIYGIEYDARDPDEDSSGLGWVVVVVVLVAAVSLAAVLVARVRAIPDVVAEDIPAEVVTPTAPPGGEDRAAAPAPPPIEVKPAVLAGAAQPARNLLMKFAEAEKSGDVVMQIDTLERLRSLPEPLPERLDADLARRLGELNVRWLFELANAQWVEEAVVKPGDSASRLVAERGSTLASFRRLNPQLDPNRLVVGRKVRVMNHPRFVLEVRAGARTAELRLNDRFFKRYPLRGAAGGTPGDHELSGRLRNLLAEQGVWFNAADRAELEELLPRRAVLRILPAK